MVKSINPKDRLTMEQVKVGVKRSAFMMPVRWFEKMFCKHKDKIELHRCYQDKYVSEVCNSCGKVIYSDL